MSKSENLMLYVCDKLKNEDTFGSTVFNKVLYYVDNISYLKTGKTISEFKYIKQKNGPTPEPRQFLSLRDSMMLAQKFRIDEKDYFGKIKKVPTNTVEPDVSCFNKSERELIDSIITAFKTINGTVASDFSHSEIAWDIAKDREELPLYTYMLSAESATENDVEWANSVVNVHY
tara:strand:+ start:4624 stop:5145 length:522 start_codon:yes stop_codon:yes gene_type:complete